MSLAARIEAVEATGAGDAVGLGLVRTLLERAADLPPVGRAHLEARAEALLEHYAARVPSPLPERAEVDRDRGWREVLDERARRRPRERSEATAAMVAEVRGRSAAARAAARVPEAAGPYHSGAVAARVLEELATLAPGYLGHYVAWLGDLATLTGLPERAARPSSPPPKRAGRASSPPPKRRR